MFIKSFCIHEQSKTKSSFGTVVAGMSLTSAEMVLCVCMCVCVRVRVYAWTDIPVQTLVEARGWYCVSSGITLHMIIIINHHYYCYYFGKGHTLNLVLTDWLH